MLKIKNVFLQIFLGLQGLSIENSAIAVLVLVLCRFGALDEMASMLTSLQHLGRTGSGLGVPEASHAPLGRLQGNSLTGPGCSPFTTAAVAMATTEGGATERKAGQTQVVATTSTVTPATTPHTHLQLIYHL